MYDFSTLPDRRSCGSEKWSAMQKLNDNLPKDVIPLSVADMELAIAPEITAGLKDFLTDLVPGYTMPTKTYFEAVCGWMLRRHDYKVNAEWIVPSPGVVPALFNAVRAFTKENDGVIIMTPVYYPFYRAAEKNGRRIVINPLLKKGNTYKIDFEDLAKKAARRENKMLILCSPHNPVGRVWTEDELRQISDICLKNDVLVVADEIHSDIIMPGFKHTVFASVSEKAADNCLICTAPSKTFNLAGLQVSNIIIKNEELRRKFIDAGMQTGYGNLNIMAYKACELAYNKCEAWLNELLVHLDNNRKIVESFMKNNLPQIKLTKLEGTYLQWWDCRALGMNKDELESFMTKKALLFLDEGYIFGPEGRGFERINLACPSSLLEAALLRLKKALSGAK